jgi:glycerol kinase
VTFLLALDQGTTSTRAMIFDAAGIVRGRAQIELRQHFPQPGWVEHDAEEIWRATCAVMRDALAQAGLAARDLAAIGITNQRETTVLWDRRTGVPIHNAIVWQDRRTTDSCEHMIAAGHDATIAAKTGLRLDPYFSASKIAWLLDHVPDARRRAEAGELAFGTIDSFLAWRLSGGRHVTDATNAARTLLYDIHRGCWDTTLLELFGIPLSLLPEIVACAGDIATCDASLLGAPVTIRGMAGDQQAAAIGQACIAPGTIKATYGTGCFILRNTGETALSSQHRLLTTVAYRIGGETSYALEGAIFVAGAAIQWLRDGLRLLANAGDSEELAKRADPASSVYLVPAFTGLGAPYWDARARGALLGLTRDTSIADIVRAALEAVCFQTADLLGAMEEDGAGKPAILRVDGGMTVNDWTMQRLADLLGIAVERPIVTETTSLGAAYLAGLGAGVYGELAEVEALWRRDRLFEPSLSEDERLTRLADWRRAVRRVLSA